VDMSMIGWSSVLHPANTV